MIRRFAVAFTQIAIVCVVLSVLLPLVPVWPLVLFEHFRWQYVPVAIAIVPCAAALRLRGWFDVAAIAALIDLIAVTSDLTASTRALPAGTPLRVLILNVHTESTGYARVRQLIVDTNPDVIGLVEVSQRWLDELAPATAAYPHRLEQTRDDNFGVALYTRAPFAGEIEELGSRLPSAVAALDGVSIILTHPLPPVSSDALDAMYVQFDAVAARARELGPRVLVMGDFNATPWSRPFHRLVAATGLCDTRAGFGVQASFPTAPALVRIPIDHVLASCAIGVRDRRVERDVGSDHLPVVLDLVIPTAR